MQDPYRAIVYRPAEDVIVAAGGLESTRLLMCSPGRDGSSIGDHSGQLGHWYMAHLEGVIADLVLSAPLTTRSMGTNATSTIPMSDGDLLSPKTICSRTACPTSRHGSPTPNWLTQSHHSAQLSLPIWP